MLINERIHTHDIPHPLETLYKGALILLLSLTPNLLVFLSSPLCPLVPSHFVLGRVFWGEKKTPTISSCFSLLYTLLSNYTRKQQTFKMLAEEKYQKAYPTTAEVRHLTIPLTNYFPTLA